MVLARARRGGGFWRYGSDQGWPKNRRAQPAGGRTRFCSAGECASDAAVGPRRGHHRRAKKSCGTAGYPVGAERRRALTAAIVALAPAHRMTALACAALGVSRAPVQRRRALLAAPAAVRHPPAPPR